MHTSKVFRCMLSTLRDHQLTHFLWAVLHCAQSSIFRGERGSGVLVRLKDQKDQFRTSASFTLRPQCSTPPLYRRAAEGPLVYPHDAKRSHEHLCE